MQTLVERARHMIANLASGQVDTATLDTARVYLFANQIAPTPLTPLSALTEPTFDGYVSHVTTPWDLVLIGPASIASVEGTTAEWVVGALGGTDTIYGAFLAVPGAGPGFAAVTLLAIDTFDTPIPMTTPGHGLRYTPHFEYP